MTSNQTATNNKLISSIHSYNLLLANLLNGINDEIPLITIASFDGAAAMYKDCLTDIYTRVNIETVDFIDSRKQRKPIETISEQNLNEIEELIKMKTKNIQNTIDNIASRIKNIPVNITVNLVNIPDNGSEKLKYINNKINIAENFLAVQSQHLNLKTIPPIIITSGIPNIIKYNALLTDSHKIYPYRQDVVDPNFKIILDMVDKLASGHVNPEKYMYYSDDKDTLDISNFHYNYNGVGGRSRRGTSIVMKFLTRLYPYWDVKNKNFKRDYEIEQLLDVIYMKLINYYKNKNGKIVLPKVFNVSTSDFSAAHETLQQIIFLLQYGPICSTILQ